MDGIGKLSEIVPKGNGISEKAQCALQTGSWIGSVLNTGPVVTCLVKTRTE